MIIIATRTPLEHGNDEKYKVKVHSRQRSLLSHSVNFIWTLVLLNEYAVCLFTLDKIVVSSVQYAIFMQYN